MAVAVSLSGSGFVTPEEYLARERDAPLKSEYIAGEILAMSGGSPAHSLIAFDTSVALATRLRAAGNGCDAVGSDQKVRVDEGGPFFYPDATVFCGEPTFDDDGCLRDPALIVEVLSPSTELFDRGEKFRHYRRIPSLRHYLVIAQDRVHVEHFRRVGEGFLWTPAAAYTDLAASVSLPDLGIELPLAELFRRVRFDSGDQPR